MMNKNKIFTLAILTSVLTSAYFFFLTGSYTPDISEAMNWHGYGDKTPYFLGKIVSVLWLAAPLFTLGFSRRARTVYTFLVPIGFLMTLSGGLNAYTPVEMAILQIGIFADGVVLTLAYTILSDRFNSLKTEQLST